MTPPGIRYRAATPRDAMVIAELVASASATYRDFAPPGWRPRLPTQEEPEIRMRLRRHDIRTRLALDPVSAAVGFTGWLPASVRGEADERALGRAHLWSLFVAPDWWGSGLAADLLKWSVDGMRDAGFTSAQLWTPVRNARARAFYEREGWKTGGQVTFSPELGLDLVLYLIELGRD